MKGSTYMASFKETQEIYYGEHGLNRLTLRFRPDEVCFHSHWHERLEVLHITEGEIQLYIDENHYVAIPGQTVIITPLMTHKGIALGLASGTKNYILPVNRKSGSNCCNYYLAFLVRCRFCSESTLHYWKNV